VAAESWLIHLAVTAWSGLMPIAQTQRSPPLVAAKSAARTEIIGGLVIATTKSTRRIATNRTKQPARKLRSSAARRHFAFLAEIGTCHTDDPDTLPVLLGRETDTAVVGARTCNDLDVMAALREGHG
jgi:hypothetical protein